MNIIELINLGGPINWVLTGIGVLCLIIIIERLIYFTETFHNLKKSYLVRFQNKIKETENLPSTKRSSELEKETTLIYYDMNRGLWLLNYISAIAPSIGLLGTVTGLISAFQQMNNAGAQVNIQALSGGIWEAMLTTAFGMIISIPSLFFYRTFKRIIEKRVMKIGLLIKNIEN